MKDFGHGPGLSRTIDFFRVNIAPMYHWFIQLPLIFVTYTNRQILYRDILLYEIITHTHHTHTYMIQTKQEDDTQVLTVFANDDALEVADFVAREGRVGVVKFLTEDTEMTLKMDFIAFTDNGWTIHFDGTKIDNGEEYLVLIRSLKKNT